MHDLGGVWKWGSNSKFKPKKVGLVFGFAIVTHEFTLVVGTWDVEVVTPKKVGLQLKVQTQEKVQAF